MNKFPKFGFRKNTHNKDGTPNKTALNIWQAHVWNRTSAKIMGTKTDETRRNIIPTKEAISFDTIVKNFQTVLKDEEQMDREEIAMLLAELVECGLVVVEEIAPYETDLYDDGVKFWK